MAALRLQGLKGALLTKATHFARTVSDAARESRDKMLHTPVSSSAFTVMATMSTILQAQLNKDNFQTGDQS